MSGAIDPDVPGQLARALAGAPRRAVLLSSAAQQIADGKGELLFAALLRVLQGPGGDETSAVVATMPLLEAMMDESPGVAGYLMARLYPIAARRRLHHTYDAIDLWMHETTSDDLAESLTRLADEGVRPRMRARYQEWAARIRSARGSRR
jgi:hypothetical protein